MTNFFVKTITALRSDERGVTLVEYGIALTLAVVVGTTALGLLGGAVSGEMSEATALM